MDEVKKNSSDVGGNRVPDESDGLRHFDEHLLALFADAGESIFGRETLEAIDNLPESDKLTDPLRARLLATMAEAQRERDRMRPPALGSYIKVRRQSMGMSIEKLAQGIDIHPKIVSGLEDGTTPVDQVPVRRLFALAEYVRAPLVEFVELVRKAVLAERPVSVSAPVSGLPRADAKTRQTRAGLTNEAPAIIAKARTEQIKQFLFEVESEWRRRC